MQSSTFNNQFSSLTLKQLQVLLESELIQIKQIDPSQIVSPQQVLIYIYQLEHQYSNNQLQKHLMNFFTKLLNDEFIAKQTFDKKGNTQVKQDELHQKIASQQEEHDHQKVFNDQSKLLSPQILQKIHSHFPHGFELINKEKVNQFSFSHSLNTLELIDIELENPKNFNQTKQILAIVENIVLPIIYTHPDFCIKGIEIVKTIMNYFDQQPTKKSSVIQSLCEIVTQFYLQLTNTQNDMSIQQIISLMTAIETIQSSQQTYHPSLTKSKQFLSHICRMLLCSNVDSKTANSIAVNMYGALLKQSNLYCNEAQIFINLYGTLRCFGAHLVKDVWKLFYDFIQIQGNDLIFTKAQLIDIIFYKIEHHENSNVVKHCIQSILQQQRSFILFNKVPDAIFHSLMRILNYGMHYLDCLFHMDSKMFPMISNFFSNFFNNSTLCKDQDFQNHMKRFLKAICEKMSFDHALVAMLHSFTLIVRKSHSIGKQEIDLISFLIGKYYVRFPIRKRHQLMNGICFLLRNHLNTSKKRKNQISSEFQALVDLPYLVTNCLNHFPEEYVVLKFNNEQKREDIYQIISENFTLEEINETIKIYALNIKQILEKPALNEESFALLSQSLRSIQLILYLSEQKQTQRCQSSTNMFNGFQIQTIQELAQVYSTIYQRYVVDLGQSLYKSKQQRIYGILLQKTCLNKIFAMKSIVPTFDSYSYIEKALTNVSLLVKSCIEQDTKSLLSNQEMVVAQYIVKKSFQMIYEFSRLQDKQMEQKVCRVGSQFLEWATDHIEHKQCHSLILTVLKTRIRQQTSSSPIEYIQQSVYDIFWSLFQIEYKRKSIPKEDKNNGVKIISQQKLLEISPLYRLRLFVICGSILFYDDNEVRKFYSHIINNIDELADRYDYQNLDQILYLIELTYTCLQTAVDKQIVSQFLNDSQQTYIRISKVIYSVIQTMLTELNYGVDAKEVIACSNCILNIMFDFASKFNHFSPQLVELSEKVLNIGQEYWMFEKMISFKTIQNLSITIERHDRMRYEELFPLLSRILSIQEYRGYDSAIVLETQLIKTQFYPQLKLTLHKQADYEGLTCRLAFVEFVNSLVEYSMTSRQNCHQNSSLDAFLQSLFAHILSETKRETRQKMFMAGQHKIKLKHWQCLLAYHPQWIYQNFKNNSNLLKLTIQDLIIDVIEIVYQNNNLVEIKYYIELFLMKLMINRHSEHIVSQRILNLLSDKLLELTAQVNKNVSFIVIGGGLMNFMFKTYHITKKHPLSQSLQRLYNTLLTYSCSHVAYFRGLSQYFCLQTVFIESEYPRILHQTIGIDPDTILLRDKLNIMIKEYYEQINYWNVRNNLFKQLPTLSGNIISDTFYIERMKKLGQQLLRQIKGEIGFLPYKQIWLQAVKSLKLINDIEIDFEKQGQDVNLQQQAIFQRKIDPSLDFIYFSKTKLEGFQMKILITGSKSIPIYGHLSRTGQIFGLSQLILPYKEIVQDEEYKNVACTAEKWLNINYFSNILEKQNEEKFLLSLEKQLLNKKEEGYTFFLLKKDENLSSESIQKQLYKVHNTKKVLLVLDSQNYLPASIKSQMSGVVSFGKYFSQHVQASIFIWQYFKQIYGQKFRSQEQEVC